MRVLLIGSTGVLGTAIEAALHSRHDILGASRRHPERQIDLADEGSLAALLESCAPLDAVICAAGETPFASLDQLDGETISAGLRCKLLGQIALTRAALNRMSDNGSVTLTSGVLNRRPIPGATCAAIVNGALEGFVRAAALEAKRGVRVNVVNPGVLEESWSRYGAHFPGFTPTPAYAVAQAYVRSVEGADTGRVFIVHGPDGGAP